MLQKVITTQIKAFIFKCPNCHHMIENPDNGMIHWTIKDLKEYAEEVESHNKIICNFCDNELRLK